MNEEWRQIPQYEFYQVSNYGRIKSPNTILKQRVNRDGYCRVNLSINGKRKTMPVHRAVALAFIPNPKNKRCINHIDNDKTNNRVDNLEWATTKENADWAIQQGRYLFQKNPSRWSQISSVAHDLRKIKIVGTNIATGETVFFESLNDAKSKGFCPTCIAKCINNKIKKHKGHLWKRC